MKNTILKSVPFDPTKVQVKYHPITVDLIIKRIKRGEINLTPTFQRQQIWDEVTQSRLIESILIRIPLPAFYIDATNEEEWIVIDGVQRLFTLKRFIIDQSLKLKELEFLPEYERLQFKDLPRNLQRRIEETQLILYEIEPGTPEKVRNIIFRRINTGGVPLSNQEVRHALYPKATVLLKELLESPEFKKVINNDKLLKDRQMSMRETILRFLSFYLIPIYEYPNYKTFTEFLDEGMRQLDMLEDKELKEVKDKFFQTMFYAFQIFDRNAFRKMYKENTAINYTFNKCLFETWSFNLSQLTINELQVLKGKRELLIKKFVRLMNTTEFYESISSQTDRQEKVVTRRNSIRDIIQEVLND